MKKQITLFALALFFIFSAMQVTHGQKIRIKVGGQKDTIVNLIKYFGKGLYYADTAMMKMAR